MTNKISFYVFNYILLNVGLIISLFTNITIHYSIIFPLLILPGSCLILDFFYDNLFRGKFKSLDDNYGKIYKAIGLIALILNPILFGIFFKTNITGQFNVTNIVSLTIIFLSYCIVYNHFLKNRFLKGKYEDLLTIIILILGIVLYFFREHVYDLINACLNAILIYSDQFVTFNISVTLLCATLALLSFTHSMVLESEEVKKTKICGEQFFIATIISIILFFVMSILAFIKPYVNPVANIDLLNLTLISFYVFLFISALILAVIILYYIIVSIIGSLRILDFKI